MDDLDQLLTARGPFASVMLNAPSATEQAPEALMRSWRKARKELESQSLDAAHLERLEATVGGLHHAGGAAVVVVEPTQGDPVVEYLDDPLKHEVAALDAVPRLGPLLESRQRSLPHVMVVTDRTGADIVSIEPGSLPDITEVEGDTEHIHRSKPGGWSQRRFQQRAENQWESNAVDVAEQVAEASRAVDARVITIAGDVRAVTFLLEHLPADVRHLAMKLEGQSEELIAEETTRAVATVVAEDTRRVLEQFKEAFGQERAAVGAAATLDALSMGRVHTLLVHDDPSDERRALFEPGDVWCAPEGGDTSMAPPDAELSTGRLIDVAIRSALMSDAQVRFVPKHGGPDGQLGALLRW